MIIPAICVQVLCYAPVKYDINYWVMWPPGLDSLVVWNSTSAVLLCSAVPLSRAGYNMCFSDYTRSRVHFSFREEVIAKAQNWIAHLGKLDTGKPGRSEVHLILDRINESGRRSDIFSQIGRASVIRSCSTKKNENPSENRLICFRKSIWSQIWKSIW